MRPQEFVYDPREMELCSLFRFHFFADVFSPLSPSSSLSFGPSAVIYRASLQMYRLFGMLSKARTPRQPYM